MSDGNSMIHLGDNIDKHSHYTNTSIKKVESINGSS